MTPPDATLPSGPIPNRAPLLLGVESTLLILAVTATALRARFRMNSVGRLRLDDWCCIGATVILVNMVIVHSIGTRYGIGKHIWDLGYLERDIVGHLKIAYIGRLLYPFATGLTRQSVLLLLLQIFPYKTFRRVVIIIIILNLLISISSCMVVAFQCSPIKNVYMVPPTRSGARPGCLSAHTLAYTIPSLNVALDLTVALLPVRVIMGITLPVRSKALILGMLGLGGFACVASVMRLVVIKTTIKNADPTWVSVDICIWAIAEVAIGIVCVSAPALKPLFKVVNICSFSCLTLCPQAKDITDLRYSRPSKSGTRSSFVLGSIKKPERAKTRLRMRDDDSIEQFRPNQISRTITEIEAGQMERYQDIQDEGRSETGDDSEDLVVSNHGIIRRMEVAVTISDRV